MTSDQDDLGQLRGLVCRSFAGGLQDAFGMQAVAERVAPLLASWEDCPLDPTQVGLGFLPSRWYSAAFIHKVLDAVLEPVENSQRLEIAGALGRRTVREHMSGLQRAVFSLFVSPDRLAKHAPKAWRHNFGSGDLTYEVLESSHISTYRNWREHHPLVCRAMMIGRIEIYGAMRLPNARVKVLRCDPVHGCRSQVFWGPAVPGEPESFEGRL